MIIDLFTERAPADRRGPDIVDPLIATHGVAIQRGRNELDHTATLKVAFNGEGVFRNGIRRGMLVQVYDIEANKVHFGKVVGINHRCDGAELTTGIQVEVPWVTT